MGGNEQVDPFISLLIACINGVLVVLRQLRARYGPIVTLHLGSEPSIFITTHEAAHKALVQGGSIFASRPPALETTRIMLSNETTVTTAPYGPLYGSSSVKISCLHFILHAYIRIPMAGNGR
ncbi:hypothetical protein OIU78_013994 [Salix suchowensis]|nr:hypothetical protein OIU78_013994 [Salix suchowensis]